MGFPDDIGIIDLGIGFPYTDVEKKKAAYQFMRPLYKDQASLEEMEFPAEYMFKNVPDVVSPDTDPIEWTLHEMDKWGVQVGMCGMSEDGIEAKRRYPDRFMLTMELKNTNDVIGSVRSIKEAKAEHDIVAVGCFVAYRRTLPCSSLAPSGNASDSTIRRRGTRVCLGRRQGAAVPQALLAVDFMRSD